MKHLSTLTVLHYVYSGLQCFGGLFMLVLVFMGHFMNSDWLQANSHGQPPPPFVGGFMVALGWGLFIFMEALGIVNFLSGRNIARRQGRTMSMVVAGIDCINFPFGTALGVFTLVALNDDMVKQEYAAAGPRM